MRNALRLRTGLAGILALAIFGCGSERPVIYADPTFEKHGILEKKAAYLIVDPIEMKGLTREMIRGFNGDPAAGAAATTNALHRFLVGSSDLWEDGLIRKKPIRLDLVDFDSSESAVETREALRFETDAYGVRHLRAAEGATLAGLLESAGVDHLILISGLTVGKDVSVTPGPHQLIETSLVEMKAQVFVWSLLSRSTVWNGFVQGENEIATSYTEGTAEGVAGAFAGDLAAAFR